MSRNYANILTAIWRNEEFRALEAGAQHAYLMLTSQPDISAAGVLPLRMCRWATSAADLTVEVLESNLRELHEAKFISVDWDDQEVLVRPFLPPPVAPRTPRPRKAPTPRPQLEYVPVAPSAEGLPKRRSKVSATKRRLVFIRDGFTCQRCGWCAGEYPDYDGRYTVGGRDTSIRGKRAKKAGEPGYRYLELDHVYPHSLGGPTTVENLQALCDFCNTSKGAKV
jgi:5-methylcytosine-specific restriction endonuclease McrA